MPRRKRTRKECERFLIREFMMLLGYRIVRMESSESPDCFLTISKGVNRSRIGVELTEYHVDAPPGSASAGRAVSAFSELVQASLVRRISHRPCLQTTWANFSLSRAKAAALAKDDGDRNRLARSIARELVAVALEHPLGPGEQWSASRREFRKDHSMLADWVGHVRFHRPQGDFQANPYLNWCCHEAVAANVGPVEQHLVEAIAGKQRKASGYRWRNAAERWLVVAASGATPYNCIGPWTGDVEGALASAVLACADSGFDRIFVWERVSGWYRQLKPQGPVVHLGQQHR
ncbi:MAG TPA: hypothetical protein VNE39_06375 [Planctomycetota bacterium]|nr:hypothetical protein [Planctomycetota bacterium]